MSGATAKGFPYPTGSDRVQDGDNAMESLARTIDTYLTGLWPEAPWVAPPLGGGWTTSGNDSTPGIVGVVKYCRDRVNTVHIMGSLNSGAGNGNAAFFLPVGFRPFTVIDLVAWNLAPGLPIAGVVTINDSNGAVFPGMPAGAGASYRLGISFTTRARGA